MFKVRCFREAIDDIYIGVEISVLLQLLHASNKVKIIMDPYITD